MNFRHFTTTALLGLSLFAQMGCSQSRPNDFAEADWLTDAEKAIATARQEGKPLFIAFLGTDWSSATQISQKEVLDTQAFKEYAEGNLVLLKMDFSRKDMTPAMLKAYGDMARGLQVNHFPVFYLADPANNVGAFQCLNNTGFTGPTDFVNQISTVLAAYRNAMANHTFQVPGPTAAPGNPSAQPSLLPRTSGASGFPSTQQLVQQAQSQPSPTAPVAMPSPNPLLPPSGYPSPQDLLPPSANPPSTAPASGTDEPLIKLK